MSDIVERLRDRGRAGYDVMGPEAADEIERLRADLAEANDTIEALKQVSFVDFEIKAKLRAEVGSLRADAERYRKLRNASIDERNRLEHYAGSELDKALDALDCHLDE